MIFSSIQNNIYSFASKLMGISSASNYLGALNSTGAESPNSFIDTYISIIIASWVDLGIYVFEFFKKLIYAIFKWVLIAIDFISVFIREIIGLNTDFKSFESIRESDIIFEFIFNERVVSVIKALIAFAVVLIILFSIFAIVKNEYEFIAKDGNNSKGKILSNALQSLGLLVLVPILAVGGIILSNAILKTLYNATAGGADISIGTQIFAYSGYSSNVFRRYVNEDYKIPITYNFSEVSELDNVVKWNSNEADGIAGMDEALREFAGSSVWNRGLTTFTMFYLDEFLSLKDVETLSEVYEEMGLENPYYASYDKNLHFKSEEYLVMADVLDYAVKRETTLYYKTVEDVYNSYLSIPQEVKDNIEAPPITYDNSSQTYTFRVKYAGEDNYTQYVHKAGAKDEAKGAVFIMARKIVYDGVEYPYYYPLMTGGNDSFASNAHDHVGQIVVAKGLFQEGVYPTAIKEDDGVIEFYRDELNVPTVTDIFPKISYEKPEGVTEHIGVSIVKWGASFIVGTDIDQFIPYVYYSFDIFHLFTKSSRVVVKLDNGAMQLDYTFKNKSVQFDNIYNISDYSMVMLIFASISIIGVYLKIVFGLGQRVLDITLLAITYPAMISTMPLDDGERFKEWVKTFSIKIFSIYGIVLGVNFVLLLFPAVETLQLFTTEGIQRAVDLRQLPFGFSAGLANNIAVLFFFLVLMSMVQKVITLIEGFMMSGYGLKEDDLGGIINDGTKVVSDIKKVAKTTGDVITGKIFLDIGKKALNSAAGFVPGSAIIKDRIEKVKEVTHADAMKKASEKMKGSMSPTEMAGGDKDGKKGSGGGALGGGGMAPPTGGA